MKTRGVAAGLIALNLGFLLLAVARAGRTASEPVVPILRAQAIELVDDRGQVRSRLNVESTGEVVFRLLDRNGTIRVKLADETTEPGVHLIARRTGTSERPNTTSITLRGARTGRSG